MNTKKILKKLEVLGLEMSEQSGGQYIPDGLKGTVRSTIGEIYECKSNDERTIFFTASDLFYKTILATQESLKIQLFI